GAHRREVTHFYRAYERQLEQLIVDGQAAGLFDSGFDPFVVTRGTLAMLNGLFSSRRGVDRHYIDQSVDTYVRLLLARLRPQPAGARRRGPTKRAPSHSVPARRATS